MLGSADLIAFVPTRDPAKARTFYEKTLGLEFISEDPFALVFNAHGTTMFAGSTTLLLGMTGSGKTTIGLQFALEGVRRGEPAIFVNFQENPAQLRRAIAGLGADPDEVQAKGLKLIYANPVELQIDSIVGEIFKAIESGEARRLVIDAIGDIATAASDIQRLHDYLYSLIQHFAVRGVTTILTLEVGDDSFGGMTVLFRVYGAFNVAVGLMATAIACTAFRRNERWAWWTLLTGNIIAYGSAMTYDRIVNAIGPFEMMEYVGLAAIFAALAIKAPFRTVGQLAQATG